MKSRYLSALSLSIVVVALAGCGGSGSTTTTEKAVIRFTSPALIRGRLIPSSYRCNAGNVWLPLKWGALPSQTQELALYIVRFGAPKVAAGGQVKAEIDAESMVIGLAPTLTGLSPGKFPRGALVAVHASRGRVQSICPPKGTAQDLLFRVYALRHKLHLNKGSHQGNLVSMVTKEALEAGTFIASYRAA